MTDHFAIMKRMRAKHPGCACANCIHAGPFTVIPGRGSQDAETTRYCSKWSLAVGAEYVCGEWRSSPDAMLAREAA